MNHNIKLGIPKAFRDHPNYPGVCVHYPTKTIWPYIEEGWNINDIIETRNIYTNKLYVESVWKWIIDSLNHESLHLILNNIHEETGFDPLSPLTPEGI